MSRFNRRVFARKTGQPKGETAQAFEQLFHSIHHNQYKWYDRAQGCPTVDMNLGSKARWKPRLSFLVSPVCDDSNEDVIGVGDEFLQPVGFF